MKNACAAAAILLLTAAARPAAADATGFLGSLRDAEGGSVRGAALGISFWFVGFEFEYAEARSARGEGPALRSGMLNVLLEPPGALLGIRPYVTAGGGLYRERRGAAEATNAAANTGGGVKIPLFGPVRLRLDYRVFRLRGAARDDLLQRVYAGVNVRF